MDASRRILWVIIALVVLFAVARWVPFSRLFSHAASRLSTRRFPVGIVIHHTATPPVMGGRRVDAAAIDGMHQRFRPVTGTDGRVYHIAYHYVVLQDGTVERGRPESLPGAHTLGHPQTLGIVLVGNFHRASNRGLAGPLVPPPAQLAAAERLTRQLMAKYDLPVSCVYLHRDLRPTDCPGDCFPHTQFYRAISPR